MSMLCTSLSTVIARHTLLTFWHSTSNNHVIYRCICRPTTTAHWYLQFTLNPFYCTYSIIYSPNVVVSHTNTTKLQKVTKKRLTLYISASKLNAAFAPISSADTRSSEPRWCEHASALRNEPPVVSAVNVIPNPGDLFQHNKIIRWNYLRLQIAVRVTATDE